MKEPKQDIFNLILEVTTEAPKLPEVYEKLLNDLGEAFEKAQAHAKACRQCFHPLIDEEGNPQYVSEACKEGAEILQAYIKAENALLTQPEATKSECLNQW